MELEKEIKFNKNFKCALVHTPQFCENPDGTLYSNVNFCAMGLYPLAGELKKEGFDVEILHIGIEKYLDKNFSLSKYVKDNSVKFLAFSLHWHPQSFSVIETIRKLKKECPDVFIALGGFTASYFAKEILKEFGFIDTIIAGEGEIPISLLAKRVFCGCKDDLEKIPNIVWKKDGEIIRNREKFVALSKDLDTFKFFDIKTMRNYEHYAKIPFVLNYAKEEELNNPMTSQGVCLGRGCTGNCTWCGGGYEALKKVIGRDFISYRSADSVIDEIKTLKKGCCIEVFRFAFDPDPKDRKHLITLLEKISDEFCGKLTAAFTLFGLPDKEFLELYARAFSKESILSISPEFYNEDLRKRHKAFYFSNNEFEEALDYMEELQIRSELYFSIIPSVDKKENEKSEAYGKFLQKKYSFVQQYMIIPIIYEPASPWTLCPEKFGIKKEAVPKKFLDYYNNTKIETEFI